MVQCVVVVQEQSLEGPCSPIRARRRMSAVDSTGFAGLNEGASETEDSDRVGIARRPAPASRVLTMLSNALVDAGGVGADGDSEDVASGVPHHDCTTDVSMGCGVTVEVVMYVSY